MNLLERIPDGLVSIGLDAPTLLAFKSHAALPTDSDWTESDALLQSYLLSAERQVDELSGYPYRVRSFTYTMESLGWYVPPGGLYRNVRGHIIPTRLVAFDFPMRPVTGTPTLTCLDLNNVTTTYTAGVDFNVIGANSIRPHGIFTNGFVLPSVYGVAYPFTLTFSAGGGIDAAIALICIFEYAAAYYRSPESAGEKLSYISQVFDANISALTPERI